MLPTRLAALGILATLATSGAAGAARAQGAVPAPSVHLGFEVGADRQLADWNQIVGYFGKLAAAPGVRLDTLGPTTQGRPLIVVTVTSPDNLRRLEEIRAAQARLADPRTLTAAEETRLVASQPGVVVIQCNIHSSEIASSQMVMELAHRLATNDTLQRALANTVVLLIPSANPDGQDMVTKWYRQNLGTKFEGGPLPWLYHQYVGHDNNRDWYMITQAESRLISDFLYRRWFPEVFYDVHQQGNEGMRLTVPPHVDPIDPNLDALIVRKINHIGSEMSLALEEAGKTGVGDGATYDLWWHGGARSTPTRHNMAGVLTEAASVRIATPIEQKLSDLRGHPRGLPKYERRVNFPNPWQGGTWRLRDIVEYELIAAEALVKMMSQQREQYVRDFVTLGRRQIRLGETEAPYAFVIPSGQRDPVATDKLAQVLRLGGVEVDRAGAAFAAGGQSYPAGSYIVRMAQPYRAHAKDLLEIQRFPKMEQYPGGPPERPYDVAGWTLPLQMGVRTVQVDSAFTAPRTTPVAILPPAHTPYKLPARRSRIALYKPWTGNMDEGWTRFILEQFEIPFTSVTDSVVKGGRLRDQFDVLLVPDMTLREIRSGASESAVPPQYAGGVGEAGIAEIKKFAESGGTVVLLDRASELGTAALGVQARLIRVNARLQESDGSDSSGVPQRAAAQPAVPLYAPGSIFRILVDTKQAVGAGMPDSAAVYFTNSVTFDVPAGSPARVIARYPERGADILLSGYLQGEDAIAGKAAAIEAPVGAGRVVMFGFRPQYRGQSYGTFKMLFNALLNGGGGATRR